MSKRGHEQPLFDNASPDSLFNQPLSGDDAEAAVIHPESSGVPVEDTIKPVTEVMAENEQQLHERGEEWEKLTGKNWPAGRIEEALDRQFPDLRTPDQIERSDVRQSAAIRRQIPKARKPKKPTRYISPRDTGPPPHILRDIRGEYGE